MLFLMLITGCTNDGASPCVPAQLKISLSISAEGTIDTRGADQYIAIAEKLLLDTEPNATEWDALFSTPYFDLLINQNNISTAAKEKDEMRIAYMPSRSSQLQANAGRLAQHLNYKEHLATLKNYLAYIKTSAVVDSTKSLVYPFLPAGLRNPSLFPAMVYTYYYAQEANGIPTGILQDLTLVDYLKQLETFLLVP